MIKVYISPDYIRNPTETGGIRRVVDAQVKYLPEFGVEVVHDPKQADIICNHGGSLVTVPGVPNVHVGHGFYWSRQPWGDSYTQVNQQVIDSMCMSVAHTAPSEWVATAIRRGGLFYPEVVYHGVDSGEFLPAANPGNYVVWAKARADYVSDPNDMLQVAKILTSRRFVSTVGTPRGNVDILGSLPYAAMNQLISGAGVYLSTARETFGIGTLEALACGVPVAGWDCGGNSEIIMQGETGYLAPWGDYNALAECIEKCFAERDRLSYNCIDTARNNWQWKPRIEQYANIFKRVYKRHYERQDKPKVSVIVTAYNLDKYLPACIESIQKQSYTDFECLIVDDAQQKSTEAIVRAFSDIDKRIKYVPTPHNLKLSGARNYGLAQSLGLYIRHMDADDMLDPNALAVEATALDNDNSLHIVYGHLEPIKEDGSRLFDARGNPQRYTWPGEQFNWYQQMAHLNQLPSTVMARREVYERSGGYRERMKRAEDAEFWCRVTSLGFRAKKITQAVTMFHRERQDSKGATEWQESGAEPDWTSWFPWRLGASEYSEGIKLTKKFGNHHPAPYLVPFSAQGKPDGLRSWYVHDYSYPVVSVVITCGPGHKGYLVDALDSVQAQTFPDWECIVVNDTGTPWPSDFMGAPWAKIINMPSTENMGAALARNAGYKYARGKYIAWLDADDTWLPWFLERMVAHAEKNDGVVFSDLITSKIVEGKEKLEIYHYNEFDCSRVNLSMVYAGTSVLYPRRVVQSVFDSQGGYDPNIPGMEDWDFQTAIHANGFCAYHLAEPLFCYRMYSSSKREKDYTKIDQIKAYMDNKWSAYRTGGRVMGCGCGGNRKATNIPKSTLTSSGNFAPNTFLQNTEQAITGSMVQVEYLGPIQETFSIRSRVDPAITYRFGNNDYFRERAVFLEDAEFLLGITDGKGMPTYRIVTAGQSVDVHDPTSFLGAPIESA